MTIEQQYVQIAQKQTERDAILAFTLITVAIARCYEDLGILLIS